MHELMLNIDNKEVLNEILHHSVDYLVGSCTENTNSTAITRSSHKYGFANPDDFESAVKGIANTYKKFCLNIITETELLSNFSHMNQDLQQSILDVVKVRKPEISAYLLRELNSEKVQMMESFDWDVRLVMGDSSLESHRTAIANICLNVQKPDGSAGLIHIETNKNDIDKLIGLLEKAENELESKKQNSTNE